MFYSVTNLKWKKTNIYLQVIGVFHIVFVLFQRTLRAHSEKLTFLYTKIIYVNDYYTEYLLGTVAVTTVLYIAGQESPKLPSKVALWGRARLRVDFCNHGMKRITHQKGGDTMEPRVEDYMDSTCVASTGGIPMA